MTNAHVLSVVADLRVYDRFTPFIREPKRVSTMAVRLVTCAVALGIVHCAATRGHAADWSAVPSRDNRGTVLIRTAWVDNGKPDSGSGTGFVIDSDGHIITVAHQFPISKTAVVLPSGETEGWGSAYPRQTFPLRIVHIDRRADVAVLQPTQRVTLTPVPVAWDWAPTERSEIYIRGFPLGGPLEGMPGLVRRSGLSSEAPTSTLLRAGFSGSPVYDARGNVVGMTRGGTPVADLKDPTVMGLGFFVPLALLRDKLPAALVAAAAFTRPATADAKPDSFAQMRLSYPINVTKETAFRGLQDLTKAAETKSYSSGRIAAQPGYRIASYEVLEHSATQVSEQKVDLAADGSSIEFTFNLTSGPGYDRKRGWLRATLVTIQRPKE
jgi:hypothetical protein